jgi:hypothetical protein
MSANDPPKRTGCSRKWLNHQISESDGVLDRFGQVNRKRTRLPLHPEQLRRAGVCVQAVTDLQLDEEQNTNDAETAWEG